MLKKHQLTSGQGDDENRHRSGAVRGSESSQEGQKVQHSQLSISSVQFCSSSGYRLRSIIQAAVVVILNAKQRQGTVGITDASQGQQRQGRAGAALLPFPPSLHTSI